MPRTVTTRLLLALFILSFVASATTAQPTEQVYTSSPNAPIPPGGFIEDEVFVADPGTIANLRVDLDIIHDRVGSLRIFLQHVDTGTAINLIDQPRGGTGSCTGFDVQITLDDDAALDAQVQCNDAPSQAYTTGTSYQPAQPLSSFDGETLSGTWRLTVIDNFGFPGTLQSWALRITPVVFTVNAAHDTPDAASGDGVCDDGTLLPNGTPRCTLRAAIQEANALGGDVTIALDLLSPTRGGSSVGYDATNDVWTIAVNSQLPTITVPNVTLDGTTQQAGDASFKDAACGGLLGGTPHLLKVMLDGSGAPVGADGLFVDDPAAGVHLRGLVVGNFDDVALSLHGDGATLTCSYVGTDHSGTSAAPNFRGMNLVGQAITVGGTAPGDGNVVSGNDDAGISNFFTETVIQGNFIGTDVTGAAALPNDAGITVAGSGLTIGGTTAAARNVISGNTSNGIQFFGLGDLAIIQGNYIGTDVTGSTAIGNDVGIRIADGSSGIDVGGVADGAGNVISGNASAGIEIVGSSGNEVIGNLIGLDASGSAALDNGNDGGVYLHNGASGNLIGVGVAGGGNVFAGNLGVQIEGPTSTTNSVLNNYFGTDPTGLVPISSRNRAVEIDNAQDNVIGTPSAARRNVIASYSIGVLITGADATGNEMQGNYIGTNRDGTCTPDPDGTCPFGASTAGVLVQATTSNNLIGGADPGAGNVISGNNVGIGIQSASGAIVQGNYVGTDAAGTTAIPNETGGIRVDASDGNLIGGTTAGAGNVVSGNTGTGILLIDALSGGNTVQGNLVGLTASGDALLGNTGFFPAGIDVLRSPNSLIGGTTPGAGNVVAGHGGPGIEVATFSEGTVVQGNYVGTDVTGTVALGGNAFGGIYLFNVCAVQVGGTSAAARNVASGNDGPGISITGSASDDCSTPSQIEGNYVGVAADGATPLGNGASGIVIERITNNRVGGTTAGAPNRIAHNDGAGILITSSAFSGPPASRIALVRNETFSNAGRGIDLSVDATDPDGLTPNDDGDADSGPNNLQNFPEITSAAYDDDSGTVEVTYLVPTDPIHAAYPLTIDFYRADASGEEGQTWLGSDAYTAADYTNGPAKTLTFNPAVSVTATDFIVATATDDDGNTSEFTGGSTQLPVELTAFDAVVDGETVLLRWSTASETNNAGFEVQVRDAQSTTNETDDEDAHEDENPDEDPWQALGWVEGHGTTAEARTYTYRAADRAAGAYRFRLKQIDFDGTFAYSPEVEVTIGLDAAYRFTAPYPNPARSEARLSLMVRRAQPVAVHVYDLLGRRVQTLFRGEVAPHQARALVLQRGDLPSGLYVVRAEGERFTATRTVTLVR